MNKLVFAAACAAALSAASSVTAQDKCWTDYSGAAVCRDAQGNQYYPAPGATDQGASDTQESTTYYRDSRGHTSVEHTDSQGDTVWRDDRGRTGASHTEETGEGRMKDSAGRTIHCQSYGYGRKICR
jgi:hypothetical protein